MSSLYSGKKSFQKYGFALVKNILSLEEVKRIRERLDEMCLEPREGRFLPQDKIFKERMLFMLPFKKKVVSSLKHILGNDLCYFPHFIVQHNMFGIPGWHCDSGSEGLAPRLFRKDYAFGKVGIFLQDDSVEYGGGITVLPKGQQFPLRTPFLKFNFRLKGYCNRFLTELRALRVDTKAGDMVVFDSRLPHRSTLPKDMSGMVSKENQVISGIPKKNTKYVFYWDSCSRAFSDSFLENASKRLASKSKRVAVIWANLLKRNFPTDFGDDFNKAVEENGIHIPTHSYDRCLEIKKRYKSLTS